MKGRNGLRAAAYGTLGGLLVSVWAAVDFGLTFLYSLIPEVNDGIVGPSFLMGILWGEDGWTRLRYFEVFRGALLLAAVLLPVTLALFACRGRLRKER